MDEYGEWTDVVRAVSRNNMDQARLIADWPLREVLLAAVERMKESALEGHRAAMQVWASKTAFGGGSRPPKVPDILK